jgi:glycosyltransferase involved in cell wall biosynthesis
MSRGHPPAGRTIWFYLDQLEVGGVERILINLLTCFLHEGWEPALVLNRAQGVMLEAVPPGVPIHDLQVGSFSGAVPALARMLREHRPAILVSQRGYLNAIAAIAHLVSGRPGRLVLMEHSLISRMPSRPMDRALGLIGPAIYRQADAVIGVSRGVARDLEKTMRLPSGSVKVLYNPAIPCSDDVARSMAAPIERPWPQDGKPLIVTVGRLSPEKGYAMLIEAFARVREHLDTRLAIIGTGPEQATLERLISAHGLDGHVYLLGYQSNPYAWLRDANAFVLSSLIESFPTVLLEAMAAGVPVVAFDCPEGPREILTPERDGLLVPPQEPEALAQGLCRVLTDAKLARSLIQGGRDRARAFTFESTFQEYVRFFGGLIQSPRTLASTVASHGRERAP